MKTIKKNITKGNYKCPECKSVIEIADDEFNVAKMFKPFPHLMGLQDFKVDMRMKTRVCDCPICGATITKELNAFTGDKL